MFTNASSMHNIFIFRPMWIELDNRWDILSDVIKHAIQIEKAARPSSSEKIFESKDTQITYINI